MKRLILIACVLLAGCEEFRPTSSLPRLDCRKVAGSGGSELFEVRHKGKVHLVLMTSGASAPSMVKLDEWPDATPKEVKP